MTQWKLRRRGRMVGPLPTSELLRALQLGKVPIDSEAQRVGDDDWAPLAEFHEFAEEIARDTPTHIMSSPWFLQSGAPRERDDVPGSDHADLLLEATPLPLPAALSVGPLPMPVPPAPVGPAPELFDSPRDELPTIATLPPSSAPPMTAHDSAERAPGFVPGDVEPVTPRVPHSIMPPAAVPPAGEIPVRRSGSPSGAARATESLVAPAHSEDPAPDPTTEGRSSATLEDEASHINSLLGSRVPLSQRHGPAPSRSLACAPRSGPGACPPDDEIDSVTADSGPRGVEPHQRLKSDHRPAQHEGAPGSCLTPLPMPPSTPPIIEAFEEVETADYDDQELLDAVAPSSPPLVLTAVDAPLGPDSMNRFESHGPAQLPLSEKHGMVVHQEITSPAIRVRGRSNGGGQGVLWSLILLLAFALLAAVYAIATRN